MSKYLDKSGLTYLWGKITALVPNLSKKTGAIPFGKVDGTSTSTKFTASVDGISEYADGVCCYLMNGVVTSASGFTININDLGAKPVYSNLAAASQSTTIFNVNYTMLFVYNSTRVTGGCWDVYYGYDSNTNTIGYQLRTNSTILKTYDKSRYYRIFFTSADGTHWIPANTGTDNSATSLKTVNQRPIDPFGRMVYCSATTSYAAEADIAATTIWDQYVFALGYSFNTTGSALNLTTKRPVYLKCSPQSDGSAIIDSTEPYVQTLPSTADGKIYIFLGVAYSATNIELVPNHPVYYYKSGAIRLWTNPAPVDYSEITNTPTIPTDTSDLTNGAGYTTTPPMAILKYGISTWDDFIGVYATNSVVYCRASSNSNPATGNQLRLAFMAYVNDATNPTEVEFQYYRSVSTHSDSQQGDQVYVYKLNKTSGWSVTVREAYTKIAVGTGLTKSYSNGVLTISLDQ